MLLDSGLLTQVPGYDDWVYVPSELSAPYFTDPSDPPSTASSSTNLAGRFCLGINLTLHDLHAFLRRDGVTREFKALCTQTRSSAQRA